MVGKGVDVSADVNVDVDVDADVNVDMAVHMHVHIQGSEMPYVDWALWTAVLL